MPDLLVSHAAPCVADYQIIIVHYDAKQRYHHHWKISSRNIVYIISNRCSSISKHLGTRQDNHGLHGSWLCFITTPTVSPNRHVKLYASSFAVVHTRKPNIKYVYIKSYLHKSWGACPQAEIAKDQIGMATPARSQRMHEGVGKSGRISKTSVTWFSTQNSDINNLFIATLL